MSRPQIRNFPLQETKSSILLGGLLFNAGNALADFIVDNCVRRPEIRNLRQKRRKPELLADQKKVVHICVRQLWRGPVQRRKKRSERFLPNRRTNAIRRPEPVWIVLKFLAILQKPSSWNGNLCAAKKDFLGGHRERI
jgi:hypothetical protein